MIYIIILFVIWTWGLTPTWVNVVVTIIASLGLLTYIEDHGKETITNGTE